MNIFVGNLSFEATGADVKKLFEGFGKVASAVIVMRKEKKVSKSRGFAFVGMHNAQQALAAIDALGGKEFMGRRLKLRPGRSQSKVKEDRSIPRRKSKRPRPRQSQIESRRKPGGYKR